MPTKTSAIPLFSACSFKTLTTALTAPDSLTRSRAKAFLSRSLPTTKPSRKLPARHVESLLNAANKQKTHFDSHRSRWYRDCESADVVLKALKRETRNGQSGQKIKGQGQQGHDNGATVVQRLDIATTNAHPR